MMGVPQSVDGLKLFRWAVLVEFVLIMLLAAASVAGFFANQQSTDALCALRADLERRVVTSQEFLREHPDGIAGIPAKTIQDGIENQKRTIRALDGLSCP